MARIAAPRELRFLLLGPLEVRSGADILVLGGVKQRAVLARLLLARAETVSTDRLIEDLWGERAPANAPNNLQAHVARLRKTLGADVIQTTPPGYRIDPDEVDRDRFAELASTGREALAAGQPARAAVVLRSALELWRGPALADFVYEPWAAAETDRLEELRLVCLEDRFEADLQLGRHAELVGELDALVREHPLRERPTRQLMLALYRAGRQADALAAYQRARRVLVDDLGLDPGPELRELEAAILRQDPQLAAPLPSAPRRSNVPERPTALVGREHELHVVAELLARPDVRLITITGPGGVGKTQLALASAGSSSSARGDVVWVPLSAVTDARLVLSEVAHALDVREEPGRPLLESVADALGSRSAVLLLDNFEHVADAADDVAGLLAAVRGAKIVITSRSPLRLSAEHELALAPLDPDAAAELFTQRARAHGRDVTTEQDAVSRIVRQLDCLPLAVELAAARTRSLAAGAILKRLDQALPLLARGPRDLPDRHQTLTATIAWSERLLVEADKRLFRALGVFAGGFSLVAAETVCGAGLDSLERLVEQSLVRPDPGPDEPRFALLRVIREYALARLEDTGEGADCSRRHALWCVSLAEEAERVGRDAWLAAVGREEANLRTALAWALDADERAIGLALAAHLAELAPLRGTLVEARAQLERALAGGADVPPELRARAIHELTVVAMRQGDRQTLRTLAEEEIELAGRLGDVRVAVRGLVMLGQIAAGAGEPDTAARLGTQALALASAGANDSALLVALNFRGFYELVAGRPGEAQPLFERCVQLARDVGRRPESVATATFNVALAAFLAGDLDGSEARLADALRLYREISELDGVAYCFELEGALALERGRTAEAARCLGASDALLESVGAALELVEHQLHERTLAALRSRLTPAELAHEWAEGRELAAAERRAAPG